LFDETFPTFFMFCPGRQLPGRNEMPEVPVSWTYLDLLICPAVHAERFNL
jgi:hypothetical protein